MLKIKLARSDDKTFVIYFRHTEYCFFYVYSVKKDFDYVVCLNMISNQSIKISLV